MVELVAILDTHLRQVEHTPQPEKQPESEIHLPVFALRAGPRVVTLEFTSEGGLHQARQLVLQDSADQPGQDRRQAVPCPFAGQYRKERGLAPELWVSGQRA